MNTYRVARGDTAIDITLRFTGCPKCVRMLVEANPHKPYIAYSNGFVTFRELYESETLNLPASWFNGKSKLIDKTDWPWPPGWDENWQTHYRR